ncbi:DUF2793 domain-containing protein [Bradyrhizobium sp. 156]|uniref:DUF2793 domain-containing protein n=1 Tax=Bradyrhizobium sp. 156 TaxID=2782630 RepID=UPI001FF84C58|nr:DUF2793 domain-containing protein [Bradyrhizobium sp. 156]MCK1322159.1 DUF2793 domain-containing protein [Bradyrhizobium sp. 156]
MPYVLADADNPPDLVAIDPSTGAAIVDITYLGRLFHYDPADVTTANDGVTCLVSSEGRRFKLANNTDVAVWGVLSRTPTAPPSSPALGDSYLVPAGATGAWAGKANYVAVKTARGWEFVLFGIGRLLYVEDIDTYYRRNAAGVWTAGLGASALAAASVTLSNVLGANASFVIKVENQTTNAPPGSPSPPTAYIIGSSPTGSWAGNAGKLAICFTSGAFTIITPVAGDTVYDKAQANSFFYTGTAWQSSAGAWLILNGPVFTSGTSGALPNGTGNIYSYSDSGPPNKLQSRTDDSTTIVTHTAKRTGATLRISYTASVSWSNATVGASGAIVGDQPAVLALFRDSELSAIEWQIANNTRGSGAFADPGSVSGSFMITAADVSSHTYSCAIMAAGIDGGAGSDTYRFANTLSRRRISLEESS